MRPHLPAQVYEDTDERARRLIDLELEFELLCGRIYYLGPLRDFPQRRYPWSGAEPSTMGTRGGNAIGALLASRGRGRYISPGTKRHRRSLEEHVARWLRELGLIVSFRVEELAQGSNMYRVMVRRSIPAYSLTMLGLAVTVIRG